MCSPASPACSSLLDENNITTQFKAVPTEGTDVELLRQLSSVISELPNVFEVAVRRGPDQPDLAAAELLRVPVAAAVRLLAARRDPAHLEHDPHGDLRPKTGDRGDEAGRRDRLVHPHPVHARRAAARPDRRRSGQRRAVGVEHAVDQRRRGLPAEQWIRRARRHRRLRHHRDADHVPDRRSRRRHRLRDRRQASSWMCRPRRLFATSRP